MVYPCSFVLAALKMCLALTLMIGTPTALKVIFCPEEVGDYHEMFSGDERSKLVDDAHKCAREMGRSPALQAFKQMVSSYEVRNEKKKILLRNLVTEAKERMKLKITEETWWLKKMDMCRDSPNFVD